MFALEIASGNESVEATGEAHGITNHVSGVYSHLRIAAMAEGMGMTQACSVDLTVPGLDGFVRGCSKKHCGEMASDVIRIMVPLLVIGSLECGAFCSLQ